MFQAAKIQQMVLTSAGRAQMKQLSDATIIFSRYILDPDSSGYR